MKGRRSEIGTERRRSRWLELLLGPGHAAEEYTSEHGLKVSEVMSDQVVAEAPATPLAAVVALIERHHIKRVPVLSGEKLIGVHSRADPLRALVDVAAECPVTVADDITIREQIQKAIDRERWASPATIKIDVRDGIVRLCGSITDDRERTALTVLAENVPGVSKVVDELVWVEPISGMVLESSAGDAAENQDGTKH